MTTKKAHCLYKLTNTYGEGIGSISCGECDKTYESHEMKEKESKLDGEPFSYKLTYSCPEGHECCGAVV